MVKILGVEDDLKFLEKLPVINIIYSVFSIVNLFIAAQLKTDLEASWFYFKYSFYFWLFLNVVCLPLSFYSENKKLKSNLIASLGLVILAGVIVYYITHSGLKV